MCGELSILSGKRTEIGIQLGIPLYKLKEFEKEGDPLAATIDYWLKGNTGDAVPRSWESVVAALRSHHVGELGLANKIEEKYCSEKQQETIKAVKGKQRKDS